MYHARVGHYFHSSPLIHIRGVATYVFCKLGGHRVDPLSGDNPLIFATGPLTGTGIPMSGRAV
ncbi:aldehyde ferredoxin oxidoreductase N-terminal domain-containing protein, partial [Sulfuracidifex metallicus]|uniref:aldehyde ferredoxin oxidoreductase N-terminal domain-containing protein n=1 Tax=Sulfuracidifex metallicus TaxID=47303 RepID=UPI003C704C4F